MVQVFSNPASGRHSRDRIAALTRALEAHGAKVLLSECGSGIPQIAPEATHVCVAGGDGTVRHVGDAMIREGCAVPMSIYPAGTVNLLAQEAGYPSDPARFAALVLGHAPRRQHFPVQLGDQHFFACASVGPDSLAVERVSGPLKRTIGRFAYAMAGLNLLIHWQRHAIELEIGGRIVPCEAFYVAKGRYYAGRWSFAKDARVHEPVLHVVTLRQARRRDYLRFLAAIATGRDASALANVEVFTCTTLSAKAAEPLPIQADGD
ncbi:MAG: diacylglycerol/lipid kinase family protein, partial [Croceibacterium sp.]